MPARKPTSLNSRNTSKELRAEREAAESAMMPKTELSAAVPARLRGRGHTQAAATWKRTVKLFQEVDGKIVTAFDYDLLIKYCLLEEEVIELEDLRKTIRLDWESNRKTANKVKPKDADYEKNSNDDMENSVAQVFILGAKEEVPQPRTDVTEDLRVTAAAVYRLHIPSINDSPSLPECIC